jgi:orotate phosphoribosyltransferase
MTETQIVNALLARNVLLTDSHFVYASEEHGGEYINKDIIYTDAEFTSSLCEEIARRVVLHQVEVETVVGPAIGGVMLEHDVSLHLTRKLGRSIAGVYADKKPGGDGFTIGRGYDQFVRNKKVILVEDIGNTGGTTRKVLRAVDEIGGEVTAIIFLWNRGGVTREALGIDDKPHFFSLVTQRLHRWPAKDCPLCTQDIPINTNVGKGREYLAALAKKKG